MKKKMLVVAALVLSMVSMLLLSGCGGAKGSGINKGGKAKYEVSIDKAFICGSYKGPILVVNLDVKNLTKEYIRTSSVSYEITAELDGEALESTFISDENPEYINPEKKIAAGKEGKAQAVYQLNDKETGSVELVGVGYGVDSSEEVEFLKETVDLAKVEKVVSESEYALTIDNVSKTDDGEGHDIVVVDMTFTNNSSEATSFMSALNMEVFQNDMSLKSGYVPYNHPLSDDELDGNSSVEIQNGATLKVRTVYTLNDASKPIGVKVIDNKSYDKAPILEKEIQLQ